jgi:hypothetical protein
MNTAVKVGIGVALAAGVGVGIYFMLRKKTIMPVGTQGGQPAPIDAVTGKPTETPEELTKLQKIKAEVAFKLKDAKCNLKFPPPRFKKSKKDAYRACLHSADGHCNTCMIAK